MTTTAQGGPHTYYPVDHKIEEPPDVSRAAEEGRALLLAASQRHQSASTDASADEVKSDGRDV